MATSSITTITISAVPTAAFSPDNDWIARDDYVLYVDSDGSLGDIYDVERSYGSPSTGLDLFQISMIWVTSAGNTDSWGGVNRSYG